MYVKKKAPSMIALENRILHDVKEFDIRVRMSDYSHCGYSFYEVKEAFKNLIKAHQIRKIYHIFKESEYATLWYPE